MTTDKIEQAAVAGPPEEMAELVLGELAPSGDATAEFEGAIFPA